MAMIDLENLTREDIDALRAVLGSATGATRSPAWKPLKDMRPPNTAKGRLNRPHFEWSADDDGNTVIKPFPRLMWDDKGIEHKIENAEALAALPSTWNGYPPSKAAIVDPMVKMQAEFDALSPEDQQFVLEAQKKARLNRLHEMMSGMSDKDLAGLTVKPSEAKAKKTA